MRIPLNTIHTSYNLSLHLLNLIIKNYCVDCFSLHLKKKINDKNDFYKKQFLETIFNFIIIIT